MTRYFVARILAGIALVVSAPFVALAAVYLLELLFLHWLTVLGAPTATLKDSSLTSAIEATSFVCGVFIFALMSAVGLYLIGLIGDE